MKSLTPVFAGILAVLGGFAGCYLYEVATTNIIPTWLIVVSSILSYLAVGIIISRVFYSAVHKEWGGGDPPVEFVAVLILLFWPVVLPISLIFWKNGG